MGWIRVELALWAVLGLVWAAAALVTRATERQEPAGRRLAYLAAMGAGIALVFTHLFSEQLPALELRWLPATTVTRAIGLALTAAGVAFAVWARISLGRMWSGSVTLKVDHHLVEHGPYRVTRHPIYTGLLTGLWGTTLLAGTLRALAGFVLLAAAMLAKLQGEDRLLAKQFGSEHESYRRRVKRLIPFVW